MSGTGRRHQSRLGLVVLAAALLPACGGTSPLGAPVAALPRVAVEPESRALTVAVALAVPGSGREGGAATGLTLLAARALLAEAAPRLRALGAEADVTCGRWSFVFTLIAPAETWRPAVEALTGVLGRADPPAGALEEARRWLEGSLALDVANPAWQASLAAGRALYGGDSPWARPPCGVVEALALFDASDIRAAAGRVSRVTAAGVVGAVDSTAAPWLEGVLAGIPGGGVRSSHPLPGPPTPGRVYVERNTVTAWVSVAWAFPRRADPEAIGVVGALLADAVAPAISRPEVFHAASEVWLHGAGGALVTTVVAAPEAAAALAAELEAAVAELARGGAHPAVLDRVARRHRGERLLSLSLPESRAARMALALTRGAAPRPWPSPGSLEPAAIRAAASALGLPARVVVGPRAARPAAVP